MQQDTEILVGCAKKAVRAELKEQHAGEIAIEEMITLLREKLSCGGENPKMSAAWSDPDPSKSGGGSAAEIPTRSCGESGASKSGVAGESRSSPTKMALPSLPKFSGDK